MEWVAERAAMVRRAVSSHSAERLGESCGQVQSRPRIVRCLERKVLMVASCGLLPGSDWVRVAGLAEETEACGKRQCRAWLAIGLGSHRR